MSDALAHHVWATIRLLDTCAELTPEQLATTVPGTFGSILETLRHLVGSDASYLTLLSGGGVSDIDEKRASLTDLKAAMERHGPLWEALLAADPDPDLMIVRQRDDGSESHAPLGIRLAQVVHHGTDHRSQVCTALTSLGIEPPDVDVWSLAQARGQLTEIPPPSA